MLKNFVIIFIARKFRRKSLEDVQTLWWVNQAIFAIFLF